MPQAIFNSQKPTIRLRQCWTRVPVPAVFLAFRELLALASLMIGLGVGLIVLADSLSGLGSL